MFFIHHLRIYLGAILHISFIPPQTHFSYNMSRHKKQNDFLHSLQLTCLHPEMCSINVEQFGHALCSGINTPLNSLSGHDDKILLVPLILMQLELEHFDWKRGHGDLQLEQKSELKGFDFLHSGQLYRFC